MAVHGDDFTALGGRTDLLWYEQGLAEALTIVVKGHLGESEDCEKETKVLNRIARCDADGLSYEADPRHAEMLLTAFPDMSSVCSPGIREDDVDYDATLDQEISTQQATDDNNHG